MSACLIALEGIDGSGKGTQAKRLVDQLLSAGYRARLIGFPRYSETFFGQRIGDFLNGRFGELWDLPPFLISLLFAGDRLESKGMLQQALAEHDVVVLDRYVASNVAHQSARCSAEEQREVQDWIEQIEFSIHGLPRPDLNLLFDLPVSMAQELVLRKNARDYTERAADLQEADAEYLGRVRETYLQLARRQPNWSTIDVVAQEELRSVEDVSDDVWRRVQQLLTSSR